MFRNKKFVCSLLACLFLLCSLLIPAISLKTVLASTGSVSLSTKITSAKPGDTITVTVSANSSTAFLGVSATVQFSSAFFEFEQVNVDNTSAGHPSADTVTFTYKCDDMTGVTSQELGNIILKVKSNVSSGSTGAIKVPEAFGSDSNGQTGAFSGNSVTIKAAASASSKPPATSSRPTAGSKASLASLSFAETDLNRAFSATVTEYSATVANTVTALTVNAKATDSDAKVTVSGNKNLKVGINYVIVKVTAPSGATRQYNITVTRQAAGSSSATGGSSQSAASSAHSSTAAGHPTSSDGSSVNTSDSSVDSAGEEDLSSETNPSSAASEADISSEEEHIHEDAPDFSEWVIHVAYIGGMIICLLLGCMLGYYIRGRKEF